MHFSIPDYSYQVVKYGLHSFVLYNIYINSQFFCTLRYRELLNLQKQLEKVYGHLQQRFPSKKIFLTSNQVEERRSQLEKYFQSISQVPQIVNHSIFKLFLLSAQRETFAEVVSQDACFEIYQANLIPNQTIINTFDSLEDVLRKYAAIIHLDINLLRYFSLYLAQRTSDAHHKVIRQLENFESPYLTLFTARKIRQTLCKPEDLIILIRYNSHLHPRDHEEDLYTDPGALSIIYHQAVDCLHHHNVDNETRTLLNRLQAEDNKVEFLQKARTLKYYNHIHFEPCQVNYPQPGSLVKISVGDKQLCLTNLDSGEEYSFSIIRIKCWRLTLSSSSYKESEESYELSLEYLINKSSLRWITINSSQSVQVSNCLQSIVGEMIASNGGSSQDELASSTSLNSSLTPNHSFCSSRNFELELDTENENSISSGSVASAFIENNIFDSIGDDNL